MKVKKRKETKMPKLLRTKEPQNKLRMLKQNERKTLKLIKMLKLLKMKEPLKKLKTLKLNERKMLKLNE